MKTPTPYAEALSIAEELLFRLKPSCYRIAIAGSLRRCKPEIGDIEIVCIPRLEAVTDLFGEPTGVTVDLVDCALREMHVIRSKDGPAFKQFEYLGMAVDLFEVTSATWGVQLTIRTGSADFSHWLVTRHTQGGALPNDLSVSAGRLWRSGSALETPEEADVFRAIGLPYIAPERRLAGRWHRRQP
jgi:DNA polymerase/3'-5' exonuclease PolX